jgi:hypothetical protein
MTKQASQQASIFARITKVDEKSKTVIGRACQEVPDKMNEILDYNTSKPFFRGWIEETSQNSGGKSQGNVRAMHSTVAAGKVVGVEFNDTERAIDISAKIVDKGEWEKVLEGVYTGFSIGGKYVNKWDDDKVEGLKRYTAQPHEVSLVDAPAIPTALFFDVVKADGSVMQKSFKTVAKKEPEPDEGGDEDEDLTVAGDVEDLKLFAKTMKRGKLTVLEVDTLVKAALGGSWDKLFDLVAQKATFADPKNRRFPLDTPAQIKASWYYANQSEAAKNYKPKELEALLETIGNAWKEKIDEKGPALEVEKAVSRGDLVKSFWSSSNLAMLIDSLTRMVAGAEYEFVNNDDHADLPVQFRLAVNKLGDILVEMCEAAMEAFNKEPDEDDVGTGGMVLANRARDLVKSTEVTQELLVKIGARNNKVDQQRIQKIHDMTVELAAKCSSSKGDDMDGKATVADDLQKKGAKEADEVKEKKGEADSKSDDHKDDNVKAKKKDGEDDGDGNGDDPKDKEEEAEDGKKKAKSIGVMDLSKGLDVDVLAKAIAGAVSTEVSKAMEPVVKRLERVESQPAAAKGALKVVGKGDEIDNLTTKEVPPVLKNDGSVDEVATEIKKVLAGGGRPLFSRG